MNIWRLQTNTDSHNGLKIADYCIENNILALGWSLKDAHLKEYASDTQMVEERSKISSFEDYSNFLGRFGVYGGKVDQNLKRFFYEIKPDDLVWIRSNGIYYLGRVTKSSHWQYNKSQTALDLDASNQITDIQWYKIGNESDVPGAIATSLIRGQALQRIWKTGVFEYSQLLFNEKAGEDIYTDFRLEKSADTFYSLLSPDDCEDLLCLWLYAKYGYITIPSTNKKSTECYECVLKDPKSGRNIYPQVKAGEVILHKKDYAHLDGEVWLLTTKGYVDGSGNDYDNIHIADTNEIYKFVGTDIANKILPKSILLWYAKLNEA